MSTDILKLSGAWIILVAGAIIVGISTAITLIMGGVGCFLLVADRSICSLCNRGVDILSRGIEEIGGEKTAEKMRRSWHLKSFISILTD